MGDAQRLLKLRGVIEESRKKTATAAAKHPWSKKTGVNVSDVERWFRLAMFQRYGDIKISSWAVKQKSLARKMLDEYGAELVEKTIALFFAKWMI